MSDYEQEMVQCEKQGVYLTPDMYELVFLLHLKSHSVWALPYFFVVLATPIVILMVAPLHHPHSTWRRYVVKLLVGAVDAT